MSYIRDGLDVVQCAEDTHWGRHLGERECSFYYCLIDESRNEVFEAEA